LGFHSTEVFGKRRKIDKRSPTAIIEVIEIWLEAKE